MNVRFNCRGALAALAVLVGMGGAAMLPVAVAATPSPADSAAAATRVPADSAAAATRVPADSAAAATRAPADSAAAARPVLDLAQCVDIALRSSLGLATADANRDAAAAGVQGAWGAFLPSVSLSRQYSKNERTDFQVSRTGVIPDSVATLGGRIIPYGLTYPTGEYFDQSIKTTYQDYGADAALNVFDGFGKVGSLKSARNSLRSAQASAGYTRQQVVENVASAYFNLLRYERLLEVAGESQALAARELERTEVYFKLGSAARSDVLQAKVLHEQTRLGVVQAQNAVEQAFANLAYAMNRPLAERFEIERSALTPDFTLEKLDNLYAEALTRRLDLQSLADDVEARHGDVTAANAGFWPSLDLFLSYARSKNESPYRFGAQESSNLGYGYRVNWNIFDRLQTLSGRGQAKARARVAEYGLEQARLDAQLEVRQIYNNLVEARERASLSRETIVQAQEALRLAEERFRVGAGTTLDSITAQVNLAKARGDEVQAICDYLINAAKLDRAVGRAVHYVGSGS
ncbi:MAG: TolC family protein [Candidatus Krumholzibacteriia bacterium]